MLKKMILEAIQDTLSEGEGSTHVADLKSVAEELVRILRDARKGDADRHTLHKLNNVIRDLRIVVHELQGTPLKYNQQGKNWALTGEEGDEYED